MKLVDEGVFNAPLTPCYTVNEPNVFALNYDFPLGFAGKGVLNILGGVVTVILLF